MKTTGYNNIDLKNWEDYSDIRTDTFWNQEVNLFEQLCKRYTKQDDSILNLFHDKQNIFSKSFESENCIKIDYVENKEKLKNIEKVQFIIFEPNFLDVPIESFYKTAKETLKLLEENRFVALIIGGVYSNSTLDLTGFKCAEFLENQGLKLKSVIIKELKRKSEGCKLFRYRSLAGGFNIINHSYVFILQKSS